MQSQKLHALLLAAAGTVSSISCGGSRRPAVRSDTDGGMTSSGGRSGASGAAVRGGAGAGAVGGGAGSAGRGPAGHAGAGGAAAEGGESAGGRSGSPAAGRGGTHASGGRAGSAQAGENGSGQAGENEVGQAGATGGPLGPLIDAFCTTARSCCASAGMPAGPLTACEDGFAGRVDLVALVEKGTVTADSAALEACVAAYRTAAGTCVLTDVLTACHGIFRGTLADGEPCTDVFECDRSAAPKICLKLQDSADSTIGVCQTPPHGTSGAPCLASCATEGNCSTTVSNPDNTVPTAFCYEADGLYCPFGYGCAPTVPDGAGCDWNAACGSDGFCLSTCEALGKKGDTCQFTFGCAAGLVCDSGSCVEAPIANDEICGGSPPSLD